MYTVRFTASRPGFNKITSCKLLREAAGISLAEALDLTNKIAEGTSVDVQVATFEEAQILMGEMQNNYADSEMV